MANPALTDTKRKALDEHLRAAITTEVNSDILLKLHDRFQAILGKQGWELAAFQRRKRRNDPLVPLPECLSIQQIFAAANQD